MAHAAMKALIAAVLSLGLLVLPVAARDASDAEKAALATTVAAFDAAMRNGDVENIIAIVPPKMFARMAADNNVTVEQLLEATIAATKDAMAAVTFVSFGMDIVAARHASAGEQPYALIPTETVMKLGEDTYRTTGDTLALLEDGTWYLVRVSEAQQAEMLKAVYPAFADVTFPPGTMEKVEE